MSNRKTKRQSSAGNTDLTTGQRILAAAREEFSLRGLEGARVDRIAVRAGVNKAMIYYHYSSKRNLYLEVIKSFFNDLGNRFREKIDRSLPLEEILTHIADVYSRMVTVSSAVRPIILRELAAPHPEVVDMIAQSLSASGLPALLQEKLTEGIQAGTLRSVDIRQAALSFVLMNAAYALVAPVADMILNIGDSRLFVNERKLTVVDLFLHGVKARHE